MSRRCALLLSGTLKTYHLHLDKLIANIVKPAHADVYIIMKPNTTWNCREKKQSMGWTREEDERLIRNAFEVQGCLAQLVALEWEEVVPGRDEYIARAESALQYGWVGRYGVDECRKLEHFDGYYKLNVDQYLRLRQVCRLMNTSKGLNFYDVVFRFRMDALVSDVWNWQDYPVEPGVVYVQPGSAYEVRDMAFLADQATMTRTCEEYPETYLSFMFSRNRTELPGLPSKTVLSPECQLAQYWVRQPGLFELRQLGMSFNSQWSDEYQAVIFYVEGKDVADKSTLPTLKIEHEENRKWVPIENSSEKIVEETSDTSKSFKTLDAENGTNIGFLGICLGIFIFLLLVLLSYWLVWKQKHADMRMGSRSNTTNTNQAVLGEQNVRV